MKRTGPTNVYARDLISQLRTISIKEEVKLWKRIASELERPARNKRAVNLSRINRFTKADDIVIVPGKVLGSGFLEHKLTIAAQAFSHSAIEMIKKARGKAMSIADLAKENPKARKVRVIG